MAEDGTANIRCELVEILAGDMRARDVQCGMHGAADGNVCYRALSIEAGARFNVDCRYSADLLEGVVGEILGKAKHLQGDTSSQTATPSSQQNWRTGEESRQVMGDLQLSNIIRAEIGRGADTGTRAK